MKIIDSHAHLNFRDFDTDREEVIKRSLDAGIWMINIGCNYETSKKAVEMTKDGVFAAVGIHPSYVSETFDSERYELLARSGKVIAIGEIGLDYYHKPKNKNEQISLFIKQLNLAESLNLPVIIHCRSAHKEMVEILKRRRVRGVVHCFTGKWEDAQSYLEMGLYIGFTGIIFKLNLEESIRRVPLDRMLVETDCPYLTPPSKSGRNEPLYLEEIVKAIAELRGEDYEKIADITTANTRRLFGI